MNDSFLTVSFLSFQRFKIGEAPALGSLYVREIDGFRFDKGLMFLIGIDRGLCRHKIRSLDGRLKL